MTDLTQLEALRSRNERLLSELQDWRDAHGVLHRTHREATEKLELLAADCATLKAERDDWKAIAKHAHGALVEQRDRVTAQTIDTAPIARLTVGDNDVVTAMLYAPGLPEGEHDVWCVPVDASAEIEGLRADFAASADEQDSAAEAAGRLVGHGRHRRDLGGRPLRLGARLGKGRSHSLEEAVRDAAALALRERA